MIIFFIICLLTAKSVFIFFMQFFVVVDAVHETFSSDCQQLRGALL